MLLHLKGVISGYGSGQILHGINLHVVQGEMVSLIGPNGAGKSTLLRTVSGLLGLIGGKKYFENQDISNLSAYKISKLGIAHVPEGRMIFPYLTVMQNLLLGVYPRYRQLGPRGRGKLLEIVYEIFPRLSERKDQAGGTLSGGEQQMLAIGRGLMAEPKMLILDEPSFGLAPLLVETISEVMTKLKNKGMTILLAEQNALLALDIADRAYLMEEGQIIMEKTAREMLQDERVKEVYLGGAKNASSG